MIGQTIVTIGEGASAPSLSLRSRSTTRSRVRTAVSSTCSARSSPSPDCSGTSLKGSSLHKPPSHKETAYFEALVSPCMTQSSSKTAWLTTLRFSDVNTR